MNSNLSFARSAPLSLLLVDDEEIVLDATKTYLTKFFSFQIDTACSGAQALFMIGEKQYDAIIADYEMEGMSGIDLLTTIREQGIDIPFIIFTGKGREEVVIAAYDHGADGYVQKGGDIRSQYTELAHRIQTIIQKKQAVLEHQRSEQEFLILYEEAPDAYFSLDSQWVITRCNVRAENLTGKTREALIKLSFFDLLADIPEGKGRAISLYNQFCTGTKISSEELVIEREDGTLRWVTLSISTTKDESGQIFFSRSILHDITHRKQTELSLITTQKLLKDAHRLAHIGIWDWDRSEDKITWSEELYRIIGRDPGEPAPSYAELAQYYSPESWQKLQAAVTIALVTGEPYDLELEKIRPDRERVWIRALGEPTYSSTGTMVGLHGTIQDISEQKKYEEKVKSHTIRIEALLKLSHLSDASPDRIFDYAIEASLAITNSRHSFIGLLDPQEQMMTIHGWSKEAMKGCEIPQKPIQYPIESAGIWGAAIRERTPQVINDYSAYHSAKKGYPKGHVPITRFLGVPIFDGKKIVAVIGVANKSSEYQEDDAQTLTAFGNEIWRIFDQKKILQTLHLKDSAIDSSMNGIALADLSGTLTYVNPAFLAIWKYSDKKEVIGRSAISFWKIPDSAAEVISVLKEKRKWTGEMEAELADGNTAILNVSAHFIEDGSGNPVALMASFIDITERKRADLALRNSEEKFRQLFNNASDAIFLHEISEDGKPMLILEVNDAACQNLGYTREELLTLAVSDINTLESDEIVSEISRNILENGHATFVSTHTRKDGTIIPVEAAAHLFTLNNQKLVISICRDITERKHAEREKDAILSGLKDIIVEYVDRDMNIIWANQAMRNAFGVSGPIIGDTCYRITQGRDSPCPGCTAKKAMDTGTFQEGEVTTPDGRHWIVRSNPVIENGTVTSVVHLAIDITKRKEAEEALVKSERELADIIDFLPDATFVVDKQGTVIAWNQAIEKMTGFTASQMVGKGNFEYSLPFYRERRPILIDLAMRSDERISEKYNEFQKINQKVISESIIANFRGEDVILWSIASPLYDTSGWLIGAIESIRDVSERKRTEDALREALDTLKTVMDSIDSLVYVSDMDTYEILFINKYGRNIRGDVIGRKCYESLQKDQNRPCSFCTNPALIDEHGNPTGMVTWEFQNTISKKWYQCHDCAIRWIDGRIVRMEIATDITQQKIAEQALRQANRQLNMLSGITRHDILNSVNALQMFFELAKQKMDISPASTEFEHIETAISLIQSQIEFTRVYQDLGTHAPQWQNIHHILSHSARKNSIRIEDATENIEIFADPLLMKVFENLIDNSIRHGGKVSAITISNAVQDNQVLMIFEDDGVGISPDEKELIFERGYGKNTGLGLFFIREILSITGITIEENGIEGIGVRFVISIPEGFWRYPSDSRQSEKV